MRTTRHQLMLAVVVLASACGRPVAEPEPVQVELTRQPLFPSATALAVTPGAHERLWLRLGIGVMKQTGEGRGETVFEDPMTAYDDVVAIDDDTIALIAKNDGYVYRLSTRKLLSRFCYLPSNTVEQDPEASQTSKGIGYDAIEKRVWVQPLTFAGDGKQMGGAQLGVFETNSATALEWKELPDANMQSGGIAVVSREKVLLGWKKAVYVYDAKAQKMVTAKSLDVGDINGLAIDGETLLVVDTERRELVSVPLSAL